MYAGTTYSGIGLTQQGAAAVGSGIASGLKIAALADPEPISKAILGVAAVLVSLFAPLFGTSKQGLEKIATTQIADQVEQQLKANVAAFLASPRRVADKTAALQNFDFGWNNLNRLCGTGEFEQAGVNCVQDRVRGGRWDWFAYYRDPIASVTASDAGSVNAFLTVPTLDNLLQSPALLLGGGLLLVLVLS